MERVSLRALRRTVWLLGYDWSDEELEPLVPAIARSLEMMDQLDTLPLRDTEPAVQYRMW